MNKKKAIAKLFNTGNTMNAFKVLMAAALGLLIMQKVSANPCDQIKVIKLRDSLELAEMMGRYKIFDVATLMKYDDDEKIPLGEVVIIIRPKKRPAVAYGQPHGNKYIYQLSKGPKVIVDYSYRQKMVGREIASVAGKEVEKNTCLFK